MIFSTIKVEYFFFFLEKTVNQIGSSHFIKNFNESTLEKTSKRKQGFSQFKKHRCTQISTEIHINERSSGGVRNNSLYSPLSMHMYRL